MKRFLLLLFPGALLFAAGLYLEYQGLPDPWSRSVEQVYPWAILVTGLVLGWRFDRSRPVFGLLILAASDRILALAGPGSAARHVDPDAVYHAVTFLLPLNIALLGAFKERAVFSWRGGLRSAFLALQVLVLLPFCLPESGWDVGWIKAILAAERQPGVAAMGAYVLSLLLLLLLAARRQTPMDCGMPWVLLATLPAVLPGPGAVSPTVHFATAGLILVVSLIESSHGMAFRDELTGLPGRRALNNRLPRLGNRYSIAMVDIDRFKRFNDQYGHDVGDQVLRKVAASLSRVAAGGKAFRYGGEEFALLFPGKTRTEIMSCVDDVRKAVAADTFIVRARNRPRKRPDQKKKRGGRKPNKRVRITISAGIAERSARYDTPTKVLKAADKALYRAKRGGRNRVCK